MSSFEQSRREQRASARRAMYGRDPMLSGAEREDIARRMPAYEETAQAVERGIGELVTDPTNLALAVVNPIVAALMKAPKMTAAGMGLAGTVLGASEVNSQAALTKAQQRQLEMDKERRRIEADANRNAEADRLSAEEARNKLAMSMADAERKAQEKINQEERNKTFLQKYPGAADALPGLGLIVGATVPAVGKVLSQRARNLPMREWHQTVNKAEDALGRTDWIGRANPDVRAAGDRISQLDKFNAQFKSGGLPAKDTTWVGMGGKKEEPVFHVPSMMFGGAAAAEASMFPDQWNGINLPEDNPEREASRSRALNPLYYLERGAMGGLTGASGYKAGAMMYPDIPGPAARSRGLVQKYGTTPESAASALVRDAETQSALQGTRGGRMPPSAASPDVRSGADGVVIVPGDPLAGQPQLPSSSPKRGGQGWPIVGSKAEQKAIEDDYLRRIAEIFMNNNR